MWPQTAASLWKPPKIPKICQGHPFPEMTRGFWCLVSAVDFLVEFFVDFLGSFSLENEQEKIHRKIHQKNHDFQGTLLTKIHSGKFLPWRIWLWAWCWHRTHTMHGQGRSNACSYIWFLGNLQRLSPESARPVCILWIALSCINPLKIFISLLRYIYIYAGELVLVPLFGLSRVSFGTTSRVRNNTTCWGAHFRTTKTGFFEDFCDKFWCQLVFFCFVFWVQLVSSDLLFSILQKKKKQFFWATRSKNLGFFWHWFSKKTL